MANYLRLLIACALVGIPSAAHGDVITDWNTAALNAIRVNRTSPCAAEGMPTRAHAIRSRR